MFGLSFLDIMSCGFGAVILIFILINHSTESTTQSLNLQLLAEITRIEEEVKDETEHLVVLRNSLAEQDDELVTTEELAARLVQTIKQLEAELAELNQSGASQEDAIEALKSELKKLEEEAANLEGSTASDETSGSSLRTIVGAGDRQYLTGMKIGGERVLILLDASASMLDKTLVNVLRRRNLPDDQKRASKKWQRAIRTVEWIMANMPQDAQFQLFTFNDEAKAAIAGTEANWLSAINKSDTNAVLASIKQVIPEHGTSLHLPFALARKLKPAPDNIFLLVDSLPTMDASPPRRKLVQSQERVGFFSDSLKFLPRDSPVNVILFPMEGDPFSTPSYWRLAQITGGSFLSPPEDWP